MTSTTVRERRHIPALDGLRGFAVLLVVFFHTAGGAKSGNPLVRAIGLTNKAGWIGVTLFFVLSGFLITGILWESYGDPHWTRNFYMRRTLRIFPLYYGSLVLVMISATIAGTFIPVMHGIWVPLLFLQNMPHLHSVCDTLPSPLPIYHFWSLAVEEQFYLVWPFLLSLQKTTRQALILCLSTIGISFLFRVGLALWTTHLYDFNNFILSRAGELAIGATLAILLRSRGWSLVRRFAPAIFLVTLCIFVVADIEEMRHGYNDVLRQLIEVPSISLAFAALLVMAVEPGVVQWIFSIRWLRWIGGISFGLYIFHVLFSGIFEDVSAHIVPASSGSLFFVMKFLVSVLGSLLLAWLSYRFYESSSCASSAVSHRTLRPKRSSRALPA